MRSKTFHIILVAIGTIVGFAVMAAELSASRLIAPYFGTSVFVWTNIIAVVLLSLSFGYYIGGRLSEKNPTLTFLLRMIGVAGIVFFVIPWFAFPLAGALQPTTHIFHETTFGLLFGSFMFVLILFGAPLMLLAAVSPYLLKLYSLSETHVGNAAGLLSAWATIGSLLGTFAPTLWLIPAFGTRATLHIIAGLLIVLGSFGLKKYKLLPAIGILVFTLAFSAYPPIKKTRGAIYETETPYNYLEVLEYQGTHYLLANEGLGVQSVYNKDSLKTGLYYDNLAALLQYAQNTPRNVLIIGAGGGTVAHILKEMYGDAVDIDGIELDPGITHAAKKYFGLTEKDMNVVTADGRAYLATTDKKYDYIIVDAYQNEIYIPWMLTTKEFWALVRGHLKDGGFTAINVATLPDSPLLSVMANTEAAVFPYTYTSQSSKNNFLIVSSLHPLSLSEAAAGREPLEVQFDPEIRVLTDDHAPVEFLTRRKD